VGWISAGLFENYALLGVGLAASGFLAALALLILIFRAASVYGTVAALVAGSAFAFNLFTLRLASLVRTDSAAGACNFCRRLADLGKNPERGG
jgi:hypothetical protein